MGTWNSPAQVPKPPSISAHQPINEQQLRAMYKYIKDMANVLSSLRNDLEYMINGHLDVANIRAKGIKATNIDVDMLSAISANLGHITAGLIEAVQIFGSYIATSQSYPRIEFSSGGNLLKASANSSQYINIVPFDANSVPSIGMTDLAGGVDVYMLNNNFHIIGVGSTDLFITASGSGNITIEAAGNGNINITGNNINLNGDVDVQGGASGSFPTPDGKTVTVQDGIVTSIS